MINIGVFIYIYLFNYLCILCIYCVGFVLVFIWLVILCVR